ncbi:hypothetical protein J4Q44_G00027950 [Coregonus suidteri]|uniref:TBC1 domain family member 31 n=1 Tax=Coregonus suidteri TaxID=861788 RepID=A0AAN8M985_9TELE
MQTTDIGNKEEGKVWHRKPTPSNTGVMVTVIRSAAAYQSKTVRFLHVTFDTTGDSFLAGDHHGNIYALDITRNRFRLVQKTGQACTALAFNLRRTTEFLVALADYSIKCFDKDTKQLVSWMRGHEGAVSSVSVHGSGRYAITTSADTAQLWDLDTFQRKRKLNVRQSVGIQRVFFLPLSNTILSCFNDDSIFAWESDTLFCKYQLPVPDEGPRIHYKAFAVTRDGKTLAAGGRSNLLHLWCLDTRQLLRVVQMPPKVRSVRQLEFLPDSFDGGASQYTLGVLSQDGMMRFINIQTCKLLFDIGSHDDAITSATISPNGRHIVTIMDNGSLNIYSVQCLTQDYNKPPPPLVKVVSGGACSALTMKVKSEDVQRPAKTSGRRVKTKVLRPPAIPMTEDKENELPDGLNKKRLVALLKAFGEYPAKYRVLSALSPWARIFGSRTTSLWWAFPIVKLFQNNPLLCFEVVATILVNWCQHWFEYFPNPPSQRTEHGRECSLAHHDKELLQQHLIDCGVTSQLYVMPLLEYPVFNKYPTYIVEYTSLRRVGEEERQQEVEYLRERRDGAGVCVWRRFRRQAEDQGVMKNQRPGDGSSSTDIEVRQMELEAQRRLFEQEVRAEVDTRRHRSEVEETTFQHLLNNDTDISLGTKKKLSQIGQCVRQTDLLSVSGSTGVSSRSQASLEWITEWQAEVMRRLDQEDADQDRHTTTSWLDYTERPAPRRQQLVDIMKDMEGQGWEEVVSLKAQLEERQAAATAEANRRVFLSQEEEETAQHREDLRRSQDHHSLISTASQSQHLSKTTSPPQTTPLASLWTGVEGSWTAERGS